MRSWLMIGIVWTFLAVAFPAPLCAAGQAEDDHKTDKKADHKKDHKAEHKKGGAHEVDHHHRLERLSKAWAGLPEDERKRGLDELTRKMTDSDRRSAEAFFNNLLEEYREKHKTAGVEKGIFKGAIEVSLWTILVFLLLLAVLTKFAWGPIKEGLNKREQSIARDKHEAEVARKDAAEMRTRLDAELARAEQKAGEIVAKARLDAEKTAAEELARGKAELQAERQRLFNDLTIARDQALKEIWTQVADVATLISGKAIKKNLSEEDHRALVSEALDEFRASASTRKSEMEEARG